MNTNKDEKIDLEADMEERSNIEQSLDFTNNMSVGYRAWRLFLSAVSIGLALYILYSAAFGGMPAWQHRAVFTSVALMLCFSFVPYKKGRTSLHPLFDMVPIGLSFILIFITYFSYPDISLRSGNMIPLDKVAGTLMLALIVEGVRRTIGIAMSVLTVFFIFYVFAGPYFPGLAGHPGYSFNRLIDTMYISTNGIFSDPIYIASTVLILFLLFASLLLRTGAGQFFIDFAFSLTGRIRGGPALASVLSSGMMGTITGNGVANASMTGPFTIPLMRKVGYSKNFSGGVEAVASQGGQIMPPIMGAAAFIMAEYTGIPFIQIAGYALIPALLYFFMACVMIYLQARKQGLKGLPKEDLPNFWDVILKRGYLIIPLILIVYMMVQGFSPMRAGMWAIVSLMIISLLRKETRLSFMKFLAAIEAGIQNSISTIMACAGAGVITGAVIMTGLGTRFSRLAIDLSGGNLLPMLLLIMVASIILGMGMPTVSAYVILATVAVGGLIQLDVPVIAAHLFVFYFGIFSGITPPVAITSYVTAGIAGGQPLQTSFQSLRIGIAGFLLPYMFIYNPNLLLDGSTGTVILGVSTATIGLIAFACFIQGFAVSRTNLWQRMSFLISAVLLVTYEPISDLLGVAVFLSIFAIQWYNNRKELITSNTVA
ncbi:C4-dicarboxylate ABC transporter permease [Salipaludibacillus keqinensis]|uniref:C4-dicarboxylate ABC transporter permease n=1 Tax=Salipaludibacillus keqinensis TaxID=2045207 RepID=A0A323TD07_9BACI|nr:TRAP transporter permease [Salipaludibacillus keqinensis]PYZ92981.1 C4-dicarboxylate ABC transporter permease [Salipaludibacillus keqinensis]